MTVTPVTVAPSPAGGRLALGVASALGAGLLWGLVFLTPAVLPEYPAPVLSIGRYLAFGLIAVVLALPQRRTLARLSRADWIEAAALSLVGNLAYYSFLAAAVQLSGVPLPTMIIGTLPVVIAVVSNVSDGAIRWHRLAPSLAVIAAGIALVNHAEIVRLQDAGGDTTRHALGALLAVGGVACWTWYPIRNARWLRARPGFSPGTWATAQGLTTLPLAAMGWAIAAAWYLLPGGDGARTGGYDFPLGPQPGLFVGLMLTIGLTASWLGTLLWNRASRLLPTSLAGQLIVFETLAALLYAFLWRGEPPSLPAVAGIVLLVLGVAIGVRAFHRQPDRTQPAA